MMKSMLNFKSIVIIVALSFLFIACEKEINEEEINAEMDTVQYELETTAHKIDRKLNDLEAKLDTVSADDSVEIRSQISKLESLKMKANNKLEDLSNSTAEDWEKLKSDFTSFINDLKNDIESIEVNIDKNDTEMR